MKKCINDLISDLFNEEFVNENVKSQFLLFSVELDSSGFPKSILKKSSATFSNRMCILSLLEEEIKQERKEMMEQLKKSSEISRQLDDLIENAPKSIRGLLKNIANDLIEAKTESKAIDSEIENILKDLKQKFGYEGNDAVGKHSDDND
jgi:septal ring factor EnvC (AmiA/AmiB activator)